MKNNKKKDSPLSVFLVLLILFGILNKIISVIAPALEILFTLFLIGIVAYVAYLIYSFLTQKKQAQENQIHSKNSSIYFNAKNDSIKRQLEILMESTALVNDSNNLDTVLHRYDLVCSCLDKLSPYSDSELRAAGYKLTGSLRDTKDFIQKNKISIVNQAIERNIRYELNQLKTNNGKIHKLNNLYDHMKRQEKLGVENILFLDSLYKDFLDSLNNNSSISTVPESVPVVSTPCTADSATSLSLDESAITQNASFPLNVSPEIVDLLWIADGTAKNYTPIPPKTIEANNYVLSFSNDAEQEPSALYLSLPISKPAEDSLTRSPSYYPSYKDLSAEQRWLYWEFLSNPFSEQNDIGYVFLFYYGLERYMLSEKLDKAFDITLKLRSCYNNSSFQAYSANTLILISTAKNRPDLTKKLVDSYIQNNSYIPINDLMLLKYKFNMPLTASEIIENHQHFGFQNNRYIKIKPELFSKAFSEVLKQNFDSDSIDLNRYFPLDIDTLKQEQREVFANISLRDYKASAPIFDNTKLYKKISSLLFETHEIVKENLRYSSNPDSKNIQYSKIPDRLLKSSFKNMSGQDFEKYCARLLSFNGFSSISTTKESGDQGIDIIAYKGDVKYGIQCKLYSGHVGNSAVQEAYSGKDFYKCQVGAVLTNNYFTDSAKELANALGVILWNGNYLHNLQQKDL